jgi:PKD repeat protein
MKNSLNLLAVLLLLIASPLKLKAQTIKKCVVDEIIQDAMQDPLIQLNRLRLEEYLQEHELPPAQDTGFVAGGPTYVIPVYIHNIYNPVNMDGYVSDAQIDSQMTALNREFARNNIGIKFCLINRHKGSTSWPSGKNGVTRDTSRVYTYHTRTVAEQQKLMSYSDVPSDSVLNIYIVSSVCYNPPSCATNLTLGYSSLPTIPDNFPLDGIVIRSNVFGCNNSGLLGSFHQGKILVHEVGHFLTLYHTFEFGCTPGDEVADTRPCSTAVYTCNDNELDCNGNLRMIHNHMDYPDDPCRYQFTPGQGTRMYKAVETFRKGMVAEETLIALQINCVTLSASSSFNASKSQICRNDTVTFNAVSINAATYNWTFSGGTPVTSTTIANPKVKFTAAGVYGATLTITYGPDTKTTSKPQLIYVTDCSQPIRAEYGTWFFGYFAGISFLSGVPVGISIPDGGNPNHMLAVEGSSTICNSKGKSLFYSEGNSVWNKTNTRIASGLNGGPNGTFAIQQALLVPAPGNGKRYYLFYVSDIPHAGSNLNNGLCYTLLDTSLNGGNGGVVGSVNQPAINGNPATTEHLMAIPHCNGQDYWIVVHGRGTDKLIAYRLTSSGLVDTVLSTSFQSTYIPNGPGVNNQGQIEVSPNGRRVAVTTGTHIYLYDFERNTGRFKLVTTLNHGAYNVSFSPNGRFLYTGGQLNSIRQYDLNKINDCSTAPVYTEYPSGHPGIISSIRPGPDSKIYVSSPQDRFISVINYPDSLNTVAKPNNFGFNSRSVPLLQPYQTTLASFPVNINCVKDIPSASFDVCVTNCGTARFKNNSCGGTSYSWQFGDGGTSSVENPTHIYTPRTQPYSVTFTITNGKGTTQAFKQITIYPPAKPSIAGDTTYCSADPMPIPYSVNGGALPGLTYKWTITGGNPTTAQGPLVNVTWNTTGTRTIKLKAINEYGCSDSIIRNVTMLQSPASSISPSPTASFCQGSVLTTLSGGAGESFQWQLNGSNIPGATGQSYVPAQSGSYRLIVTKNGCSKVSPETQVTLYPKPAVTITASPGPGCSQVLTASPSASYQWKKNLVAVAGATSSTYTATSNGVYSVVVSNGFGCTAQSANFSVFSLPNYKYGDLSITGNPVTWNTSNTGTPVLISGTLTVKTGATLTISGNLTLEFGPNGKIVVEKGGRLNLYNGCVLKGLTSCGNMWPGIEVYGFGGSACNCYNDHGRLVMNGGATIRDAHIGITLGKPCNTNNGKPCIEGDYRYGIIELTSASFINNGISIWMPFHHLFASSVINCTFQGGVLKDTLYNSTKAPAGMGYPNATFPNYGRSNPTGRSAVGIYANDSPRFFFYKSNSMDNMVDISGKGSQAFHAKGCHLFHAKGATYFTGRVPV